MLRFCSCNQQRGFFLISGISTGWLCTCWKPTVLKILPFPVPVTHFYFNKNICLVFFPEQIFSIVNISCMYFKVQVEKNYYSLWHFLCDASMKQVQQFLLTFLLLGRKCPLGDLLQTWSTGSKCSRAPDSICILGTWDQ